MLGFLLVQPVQQRRLPRRLGLAWPLRIRQRERVALHVRPRVAPSAAIWMAMEAGAPPGRFLEDLGRTDRHELADQLGSVRADRRPDVLKVPVEDLEDSGMLSLLHTWSSNRDVQKRDSAGWDK